MSLPEFSVRQIVLVNLLFAIVLVSGFLAATRIPIDVPECASHFSKGGM